MKRSYKQILSYFGIGWCIAVVLWLGLRTPGLIPADDPNFNWVTTLYISPFFVLLATFLFGSIAYWVENSIYGKVSLRKLMFSVFSLQSIATLFLVLSGVFMYRISVDSMTMTVWEAVISPSGGAFILFAFFINLSIIFFRQMSLMIGTRRLSKILFGRFYSPRDEYVAFLFMDLKSSVETAQALGSTKYSLLIQDCFRDVSAVEPHGAQIYQYIGDEVVLCWYKDKKNALDECIYAWQAFSERIASHSEYYLNTYGLVPVFRGGLHAGHVVTAEIGVYRRDIAHHGNTINLAARVQEYGKSTKENLVLTSVVYDKISADLQSQCKSLGNVQLRNIGHKIVLYEI